MVASAMPNNFVIVIQQNFLGFRNLEKNTIYLIAPL